MFSIYAGEAHHEVRPSEIEAQFLINMKAQSVVSAWYDNKIDSKIYRLEKGAGLAQNFSHCNPVRLQRIEDAMTSIFLRGDFPVDILMDENFI